MLINVYTAESDKIRWQNVLIFVHLCWNLLTCIKFFETAFPDNDTYWNYRNLTTFIEIQWYELKIQWYELKIVDFYVESYGCILKCIGICWNTLKCFDNCLQSVQLCWQLLQNIDMWWNTLTCWNINVEILNFIFPISRFHRISHFKFVYISDFTISSNFPF